MQMKSGVAYEGYFDQYYHERHYSFYNFLLHEVIRYSKPGKILDVGSGAGFFLQLCTKWGLDIVGIEGSDDAIEAMNSRFQGLRVSRQLLDQPFPFDDKIFQTVVFNEVIEHLELSIQTHCLREIYRVLKPGGALIIHSPSRYNTRQKEEDPTHINLLSPKELAALLRQAGFEKLTDINAPLYVLGENRFSKKIVDLVFRYLKIERLSATASFVAVK